MPQELELDDIQATVLRNRPMPYCGTYVFMRIKDAAEARILLQRLIPRITPSGDWQQPADSAWINIVFTYAGFAKLGVPQQILDGFPLEFRVPMANRKEFLGDVGESDPEHWDHPYGTSEIHVGLMLMAPHQEALDEKLEIGRAALKGLPGVEVIATQHVELPPTFREHFGFNDGISRPFIEGQGGIPLPGQGEPFKAGEFFLGYMNEIGELATGPGPEEFWRNGTYLAIRKIHQKVAEFRRFLIERSKLLNMDGELLAAKMVGRWRSGCPLALSPERDDQDLAKDPTRNNAFAYLEDDPKGHKTPAGSHIRRVNPRDALDGTIINSRLHRTFRRGSSYGPALAEDCLADDGIDRGIVIAFVNANPGRQFEFVQSQWVNDGDFISAGSEKDPVVGVQGENGQYTFPANPVRRKLTGMPAFVVTKGGEHVFLPSITGLRWLARGDWK